MQRRNYIVFLIIFAFTSLFTMEGPQKKRARVEQTHEETTEATPMIIPEQEELLRSFLRNEEEIEQLLSPKAQSVEEPESPLLQMPDEILLKIIEHIIPEQTIINLLTTIEQDYAKIYNLRIDTNQSPEDYKIQQDNLQNLLKKDLQALFNEFSAALSQLNKISFTNTQLQQLIDNNTEFLINLLKKKLHLFAINGWFPKTIEGYLGVAQKWADVLQRKLNIFSHPMQKIVKRLIDEVEIINQVENNNYQKAESIKTLLQNNNLNPDDITIVLDSAPVRLLSLYLDLAKEKKELNAIMLQMLLDAGANPNFIEGKDLTSPLISVIKNKDLVTLLLEKGADANAVTTQRLQDQTRKNRGFIEIPILTYLISTAYPFTYKNIEEIITMLLNNGANPNINISIPTQNRDAYWHDFNPLSEAIAKYKKEPQLYHTIITLLLDKGADVNLVDSYGMTPLDVAFALELKEDPIIDLLLNEATITARNHLGQTLLMRTAQKGDFDLVSKLISKGANVNIQDNDGNTALMHAALNNKKEIVELLLNEDATNYKLQNKRDETAADIARRYSNDNLAKFIETEIKKKEDK